MKTARIPMFTASALLVSAVAAPAQSVTVVQSTRTVEAGAYGYDYDFDGGVLLGDAAPLATGPWTRDLVANVDDYEGFAVGGGSAVLDSDVSADRIEFTLDALAGTAGNHFSADAQAECIHDVTLAITQRVRYAVVIHVEATAGYNEGAVALRQGTQTVFGTSVLGGGSDDVALTGWLDPGTYRLEANATAFAYGTHGAPDLQSGLAECDLRLVHAGDWDADGDVDLADRQGYLQAWAAQSADADWNGDGNVDRLDGRAFIRAWRDGVIAG